MTKERVTVYLTSEVAKALHAASLAAGGYGQKSAIVERALRRELGLMMDVRMTPGEAWEGFVGSQGVTEFLAISRDKGFHTPEAAVAAYLDESYEDLVRDIEHPISRDALEELLLRYVEMNLPSIDAEA